LLQLLNIVFGERGQALILIVGRLILPLDEHTGQLGHLAGDCAHSSCLGQVSFDLVLGPERVEGGERPGLGGILALLLPLVLLFPRSPLLWLGLGIGAACTALLILVKKILRPLLNLGVVAVRRQLLRVVVRGELFNRAQIDRLLIGRQNHQPLQLFNQLLLELLTDILRSAEVVLVTPPLEHLHVAAGLGELRDVLAQLLEHPVDNVVSSVKPEESSVQIRL